jgi:hypothetical protein
MPAKAVDARKRFDLNDRFRGHGPLLQRRCPIPRRVVHPPPLEEGPMAPNPSAMQGARWMRVDRRQCLRAVLCLPNPSAMQGARWMQGKR